MLLALVCLRKLFSFMKYCRVGRKKLMDRWVPFLWAWIQVLILIISYVSKQLVVIGERLLVARVLSTTLIKQELLDCCFYTVAYFTV